jgi:predicted transcriptional regulator
LNDSVKETMRVMQEKLYTHIPILENNKVVGIFDENSLFSFLATNNEDIFEFDDKLTFGDMKEHIKLDNREMEEFKFFPINKYTDDAVEEFNKCLNVA